MATPLIALRFRDVVQDVDTIENHKKFISEYGYVWWGWWKKSFEDLAAEHIDQTQLPIEAYLVDRSTTRMFRATVENWRFDRLPAEELDRVPSYYRFQEAEVSGWLKLTSIEAVEYIEDVASSFGDGTFVFSNSEQREIEPSAHAVVEGRTCLLNLSDLHFGPDYDFLLQGQASPVGGQRKTLTDCIVSDLERLGKLDRIGCVVVTGDFITAGRWDDATRKNVLDEFAALREALGLTLDQVIAVPGNHDIVRYDKDANVSADVLAVADQVSYKHEREFRTFVDELVGRSWKEPLNYVRRIGLDEADLLIAVLNSCTIAATEWTEYGYVGEKGLKTLEGLATEPINRPTYRLMAVHHHLLPVSQVAAPRSKGVTLSLDATELLDAAQAAGVHVALHGHEHMPRLAKYQTVALNGNAASDPLLIVSNGSAGVGHTRRPGSERNTYCLFELDAEKMGIWLRELRPDGKAGTSLFEGDLDVHPVT